MIHAALKHDDERVRCACAESAGRVDPRLGKALFYLQSYDSSDHVRDNAFESLWHIDTNDLTLARMTCDRLLTDEDQWVRETAKRYKTGDTADGIVYDGSRGGRYVVDENGKRKYLTE